MHIHSSKEGYLNDRMENMTLISALDPVHTCVQCYIPVTTLPVPCWGPRENRPLVTHADSKGDKKGQGREKLSLEAVWKEFPISACGYSSQFARVTAVYFTLVSTE